MCLVTQSCLTPYDPMDCCPPGSSLSMEFSRLEYWSGLLVPSPGNLPDPGIKCGSLALQADSLLSETPGKPQKYSSTVKELVNRSWHPVGR